MNGSTKTQKGSAVRTPAKTSVGRPAVELFLARVLSDLPSEPKMDASIEQTMARLFPDLTWKKFPWADPSPIVPIDNELAGPLLSLLPHWSGNFDDFKPALREHGYDQSDLPTVDIKVVALVAAEKCQAIIERRVSRGLAACGDIGTSLSTYKQFDLPDLAGAQRGGDGHEITEDSSKVPKKSDFDYVLERLDSKECEGMQDFLQAAWELNAVDGRFVSLTALARQVGGPKDEKQHIRCVKTKSAALGLTCHKPSLGVGLTRLGKAIVQQLIDNGRMNPHHPDVRQSGARRN